MGVTASQIRQDFNCFGGFGQQGYGYNVENLYSEIGKILGLDSSINMIIVGAGNLGKALANYRTFASRGYVLVGIFDSDEAKIGQKINNVEIMDIDSLSQFTKNNKVDIAILTVPLDYVNEVAKKVVDANIKGLLNFSYTDLELTENV